MNNRFLRNGIVTLVLVVGTAALLYMLSSSPISPSRFPTAAATPARSLSLVAQGKVKEVTQRANQLEITLTR